MEIKKLNNNNFDEVVFNSEKPILVEFYANWCKYCNMINPIIDEYEKTSSSDIIIGKVNTDEEQELAKKYNIEVIPTFMLVKDKKIILSKIVTSKDDLDYLINL